MSGLRVSSRVTPNMLTGALPLPPLLTEGTHERPSRRSISTKGLSCGAAITNSAITRPISYRYVLLREQLYLL